MKEVIVLVVILMLALGVVVWVHAKSTYHIIENTTWVSEGEHPALELKTELTRTVFRTHLGKEKVRIRLFMSTDLSKCSVESLCTVSGWIEGKDSGIVLSPTEDGGMKKENLRLKYQTETELSALNLTENLMQLNPKQTVRPPRDCLAYWLVR